MDSALRQRFLNMLSADLAKIDLIAQGVKFSNPDPIGPRYWPIERAWWTC